MGENGTLDPEKITRQDLADWDRFGYKIVAVRANFNGWCAFRGPTDWSDYRVFQEGEVLDATTAKCLFPNLAELGGIYGSW